MLNLNPTHFKIRIITTAGDRLLEPEGGVGAWRVVDWRPLMVPQSNGVAFAWAVLWVHPICRDCRNPINPSNPLHAPAADGGIICSGCIIKTGGPLQGCQLCPECVQAIGQGALRKWLPYCSAECMQRGANRRDRALKSPAERRPGDEELTRAGIGPTGAQPFRCTECGVEVHPTGSDADAHATGQLPSICDECIERMSTERARYVGGDGDDEGDAS